MYKRLAVSGIGLALLASPLFASALTTDVQSQINALLAQIKVLQAQIAQLQGQSSTGECITLGRTLTLGSKDTPGNADVSTLQTYLIHKGYLDAQYQTGYYGFLTAQAVGKLQVSLGILPSSADPAYGIMGPRTRAAISCGSVIVPPTISSNFSATPMFGSAPLAVTFSWDNYKVPQGEPCPFIEFGDGSSGHSIDSCPTSAAYTYRVAGTYTATLTQVIHTCPVTIEQVNSGQPQGCPIVKQIGTTKITVTGNPMPSASLSALPTSGSAPLTVQFSVDTSVLPPFNIAFGDGQEQSIGGWGCADSVECANWRPTWSHVYTSAGTYTATLSQHIGGPMGPEQLLSSVTVIVK